MPSDLEPSAWARARSSHPVEHDLTVTNPTACGFPYPDDLLRELASPASLSYRPDPKGLVRAREAVATEYGARGVAVDPERIVLTASSSEAYGFLFKMLCDPGDTVLVPAPSYPLFEHLASLDGVRTVTYALDQDHEWQPTPPRPPVRGARAALLVHPNNPTGSWVGESASEGFAPLPLIVDEVFLDFPLDGSTPRTFAARENGLTFTLGGLSKSRGLPQLKLSWIVVTGPDRDVAAALPPLEFIADTYLSVATPVQEALPSILKAALPVQQAIRDRCAANLATARAVASRVPAAQVLRPGGGWSVIIRYPNVISEDKLVLDLLRRDRVAIHPGYFFDFPAEGYLVASLLPERAVFDAGLARVIDAIANAL
jgi:aspartate/methionine/tyrosine aminotransferase